VADAIGWATLYSTSAIPLLRSAARTVRTGRAQALRVLARQASNGGGSSTAAAADWYAPPSGPPWATALLRNLAAEAIGDAAAAAEQSLDPADASAQIAWENIIEIGRTAAADGHLANTATGVVQHNPFADSAVVAAALSCPSPDRADPYRFKPLLIAAFPDLLPPSVIGRSTKGDSTSDHIRGLRVNLSRLQESADGHLAEHGLLDPQGLRELLTRAAAGIPAASQLIQPAIATETWLRSLMSCQPPEWTTIVAAEAVEARTP
jgi:asparagine synthase (glutamine-hydrolysing)